MCFSLGFFKLRWHESAINHIFFLFGSHSFVYIPVRCVSFIWWWICFFFPTFKDRPTKIAIIAGTGFLSRKTISSLEKILFVILSESTFRQVLVSIWLCKISRKDNNASLTSALRSLMKWEIFNYVIYIIHQRILR